MVRRRRVPIRWKKVSGDVTLTADISFIGKGVNEHRKAVLMVRQSLDADSAYADLALHGSGLTSLQYRDEKGAATHEIQANTSDPKRLRIEKRGAVFHDVAGRCRRWNSSGGRVNTDCDAGTALCRDRRLQPRQRRRGECGVLQCGVETAAPTAAAQSTLYSTLEIIHRRFHGPARGLCGSGTA